MMLLKSYRITKYKISFYKERLLPGAARNTGVSISENELIAFLDSKTLQNLTGFLNLYNF